ncbi:hypothetical protein [Actibacterium lipolyticum]|uniref:hypothetical protein n=1 Tax=Actibacterium lipolyticum TaxID=1524263 RepID=UPI001F1EB21E|nr:hypothetical protein [Actibacterium lipolyticum]
MILGEDGAQGFRIAHVIHAWFDVKEAAHGVGSRRVGIEITHPGNLAVWISAGKCSIFVPSLFVCEESCPPVIPRSILILVSQFERSAMRHVTAN